MLPVSPLTSPSSAEEEEEESGTLCTKITHLQETTDRDAKAAGKPVTSAFKAEVA